MAKNPTEEDAFTEIAEPSTPGKYTNHDLLVGKGVDPIDQLRVYGAGDWEKFVNEWACAVLKGKYRKVWKWTAGGGLDGQIA